MKARLLACPGCARHVRVSEPSCLFCGLVLPESFRNEAVVPRPPRMTRGGRFTYRARAIAASTAALVTASCGGALEAGSQDGAAADGNYSAEASDDGSWSESDAFTAAYGAAAWVDASDANGGGQDASLWPDVRSTPVDGGTSDAEPLEASRPDAEVCAVCVPYGLPPPHP